MLDVKKIIFDLGLGLFQAGAVLVFHLRPSRQAGTNAVPQIEEGDLSLEQIAIVRYLGPWTNQPHYSTQNVYQLGQLVEAKRANEGADAGNPAVPVRGPARLVLV